MVQFQNGAAAHSSAVEMESLQARQIPRAPSPLWGGLGWGSGGEALALTTASHLATPTPDRGPHRASAMGCPASPQGGGENHPASGAPVPSIWMRKPERTFGQ